MAKTPPKDPIRKQLRLIQDHKLAVDQSIDFYLSRYAASQDLRPKDRLPRLALDLIARDAGDPILVAPGEIVVRREDEARAAAILGRRFTRRRPARVPGVSVFTGPLRGQKLLSAIQHLRAHCVDASPNAISAFGMRSKAFVTAEHPPGGAPFKVVGGPNDGAGVHVVVLDTGLAAGAKGGHNGLFASVDIGAGSAHVDRLTAINEALGNGPLLDAAAGHGTFVAAMVLRQAPKASVTMVRVLNSDGLAPETEIAAAIKAAADRTPDIINMSFGSEDIDGSSRPVAIAEAIAYARARSPKTLLVAAAGNDGGPVKSYPAALPAVVAVAGLSAPDTPAAWSTRGPWVSVSAVAQGIPAPYVAGTESSTNDPQPDTWVGPDPVAVWIGTSFAAPAVSGAVATEMSKSQVSARVALDNLMKKGKAIADWGVALKIK